MPALSTFPTLAWFLNERSKAQRPPGGEPRNLPGGVRRALSDAGSCGALGSEASASQAGAGPRGARGRGRGRGRRAVTWRVSPAGRAGWCG
jgi:hypothetical protein